MQIEVKYDNKLLLLNKDYIVKYENNINAGEGRIKIDGVNNFLEVL